MLCATCPPLEFNLQPCLQTPAEAGISGVMTDISTRLTSQLLLSHVQKRYSMQQQHVRICRLHQPVQYVQNRQVVDRKTVLQHQYTLTTRLLRATRIQDSMYLGPNMPLASYMGSARCIGCHNKVSKSTRIHETSSH